MTKISLHVILLSSNRTQANQIKDLRKIQRKQIQVTVIKNHPATGGAPGLRKNHLFREWLNLIINKSSIINLCLVGKYLIDASNSFKH